MPTRLRQLGRGLRWPEYGDGVLNGSGTTFVFGKLSPKPFALACDHQERVRVTISCSDLDVAIPYRESFSRVV